MDFTREPIIETIITPKEGCKLVVRSSKSTGQEEYFVDAVEVVSFGHSFFFRSLERPKMFFVPATDYEILEVRETRMVLKNVGVDRAIKIAGGREQQNKPQQNHREQNQQKAELIPQGSENVISDKSNTAEPLTTPEKTPEERLDKKRDRRRNSRRRRGREGEEETVEGAKGEPVEESDSTPGQSIAPIPTITSLLPPPPTLISETIARYKDNALFKNAFYTKEEQKATVDEEVIQDNTPPTIQLEAPEYGSFEVSKEEEEQIYQQRKLQQSMDHQNEFNFGISEENKPLLSSEEISNLEETPFEP